MATISVSLPADGTTADVADYNTPITTVVNAINGGLDNDNIKVAAAIDGSKLADGSVANAKLSTTAGEIGAAWQSWTPTWTNLTVGAGGVVLAKYVQIGKTVHYRLNFTFGTGSAVGDVVFSLPVAAVSTAPLYTPIGDMMILDSGTATYSGIVIISTSTTAKLYVDNTASTYSTQSNLSASVPMTWTTNDQFFITGVYEAA